MNIEFGMLFTIVMCVFFVGLFSGTAIGLILKSVRNPNDLDYVPEFNWKECLQNIQSWLEKRLKTIKSWLFLHGIYVKSKIKQIDESEIR